MIPFPTIEDEIWPPAAGQCDNCFTTNSNENISLNRGSIYYYYCLLYLARSFHKPSIIYTNNNNVGRRDETQNLQLLIRAPLIWEKKIKNINNSRSKKI